MMLFTTENNFDSYLSLKNIVGNLGNGKVTYKYKIKDIKACSHQWWYYRYDTICTYEL